MHTSKAFGISVCVIVIHCSEPNYHTGVVNKAIVPCLGVAATITRTDFVDAQMEQPIVCRDIATFQAIYVRVQLIDIVAAFLESDQMLPRVYKSGCVPRI